MESEKPTKLPLWATVKDSYKITFSNWNEYLKISQWWLLISLPIALIYNLLIWPDLQPHLCIETIRENIKNHGPNSHSTFFLTLPKDILMLLLGSSIAVAWHRLILRNEHITTDRYLRLDNVVLGYLIYVILLWFISMFPDLFGQSTVDVNGEFTNINPVQAVVFIVLSIFLMLASIRLSIMLPAKALAITEITTIDVWKRTKGNFWRLFIGNLLCVLPIIIIINFIVIFLEYNCRNDMLGIISYTAISLLGILIFMPIILSFLSLSYRHFFEKNKI